MSFIVILACLSTQWFLNLSSALYTFHWAGKYTQWMMNDKFSKLASGHGFFTVLLLVLPIVIVMSLLFTIVYHTLGHVGYLILSLLLLWYCVDVTILKKTPTTEIPHADLLLDSYQKIFAPLLWYFVLGPVGLVIYVVVATLRAQLPAHKYFILTQGVLDWVPIRVLGLTFALAGNFGSVIKVWMRELFQSVSDSQNQVVIFGESALESDSDVMSLVRRALLIWLVIMALITVGGWIG